MTVGHLLRAPGSPPRGRFPFESTQWVVSPTSHAYVHKCVYRAVYDSPRSLIPSDENAVGRAYPLDTLFVACTSCLRQPKVTEIVVRRPQDVWS